jgi:hypothetical protein
VHNEFIILTDLKNVVPVLPDLETDNTIIRNIIEMTVTLLVRCGQKDILYSWMSSHVDIKSSEKVK